MPPVVVDGEHETGRTRPAGDHVLSLGDLPDDIVAAVLVDVAAAADRPGDLLSIFMTLAYLFLGPVLCLTSSFLSTNRCKKFYSLGWSPSVVKSASPGALSIPAKSWCPGAKIFLQRCEEAGSIDASFMLGMVSELFCSEFTLLAFSNLLVLVRRGDYAHLRRFSF
jgi:hypothetical protein